MAGEPHTLRAWAGISSDWEQVNKTSQHTDNLSLNDAFEDAEFDKERRQRLLDRIRREERAEGIYHPEKFEGKYDRWANDAAIS